MVLNRKGSIAMIDAMVFIILLSAVSITMFTGIESTEIRDEPLAKDVCDDFFSIRVSSSMLFDTEDAQIFPIAMLIASNINSGHTSEMKEFVKETMDDLIPEMYGYEISMGYDGKEITVERQGYRDLSSEYTCSQHVVGPKYLDVRIRLY